MTGEKAKVKKNLEMIHKFIAGEAPVSFERVCIACGFSPSKLYSYIPLIHEEYPWIRYNNKTFSFDSFIFIENNPQYPNTHSTQTTNKQTRLEEEEKEVEK